MRCVHVEGRIRIIAESKEDFSNIPIPTERLFSCIECIHGQFYLKYSTKDCPFLVEGKCTVRNCCSNVCLIKEAKALDKEFNFENDLKVCDSKKVQ